MAREEVRRAYAFAPDHVTGVFAPRDEARDPRARGSVGAGLVLANGVRASVVHRPGGPRRLRVVGDRVGPLPISEEVARRLGADVSGTLVVRLEHDLPIGQGFGTSAAGATATALAIARLVGLPRRRAIELAHLADLFGGGGLGGVAAILGGGLEIRRRPGIPPFGDVRHVPFAPSVLVGVVGRPIPSVTLLGDPKRLARIRAASRGWNELERDPAPERFFALAERFTDRAGLADPPLRAILTGLRRRRARAFQAMFGRTFVALVPDPSARADVVRWLAHREVPVREMAVARSGARALAAPPATRPAQAF